LKRLFTPTFDDEYSTYRKERTH